MCRELSLIILAVINNNLGKLILNKSISIDSPFSRSTEIKFVEDKLNIKLSNRTYGNMNPEYIFINGSTVKNVILNLEIELSPIELSSKIITIDNKIFKIIRHEILHIVEMYLTKKNEQNLSFSWEMGKRLQFLQNKYEKSKNWQDISYFIYLSLPHEIRSKVEELNALIESNRLKGILNVYDFIKTTKTYKDVEFLSTVDENIVLHKLKNDTQYQNIIKDFCEYFLKSKSDYEIEFLNYFKSIKKKNKKLIKKLLRSSYNFENYINFDNSDRIIKYSDYK